MTKAERARATHNAAGRDRQQRGLKNEAKLARYLPGAKRLQDNEPFDVVLPGVGIEVKTITRQARNDKVTMSRSAIRRKKSAARKEKRKMYTAVFHERTNSWYISKKVGSIRLGSMTKVTVQQMKERFAS